MGTQSRAIPVILTRPAAQGQRFAQGLTEKLGERIRLIQSPLLAPTFFSPRWPDISFRGVVFTSETAVEGSVKLLQSGIRLPMLAYCVGDHTADMARQAGFDAKSSNGNAANLVQTIKSAQEVGPLLHLRGEESRGDVAEGLSLAGIETIEAILYAQRAQQLSTDAVAAIADGNPIVFPVFSPRTGAILAKELRPHFSRTPWFLVAMSDAVQDAVTHPGFRGIFVARQPNAEAMIEAVELALVSALTP
jgi:uroporphyrinogen-III synthase